MGHEIRDLNRSVSLDSSASDFVSLIRTMLLARYRGLPLHSMADAPGCSPRVQKMLANPDLSMAMKTPAAKVAKTPPDMMAKASVPPTLVTDFDYQVVSTAFLVSVGQFSAFERILGDRSFMMTPLRAWVRVMTSDPTGSIVDEGRPAPVLRLTAEVKPAEPVKATALAAFSDEAFLRNPSEANTLIGAALRKSVAKEVDVKFLALATAGAASAASSGLTPSQVLSDLSAALASITFGSDARLYAIVPAAAYAKLTLANSSGLLAFPSLGINGGQIGAVRVIPTDLGSDGYVIDASQIAASDGGLETFESINATMMTSDDPTTGAPSQLISMFQANMVGVRLTRYFTCTPLRDHVAAVITGMAA